jgi:hypothetical protein
MTSMGYFLPNIDFSVINMQVPCTVFADFVQKNKLTKNVVHLEPHDESVDIMAS